MLGLGRRHRVRGGEAAGNGIRASLRGTRSAGPGCGCAVEVVARTVRAGTPSKSCCHRTLVLQPAWTSRPAAHPGRPHARGPTPGDRAPGRPYAPGDRLARLCYALARTCSRWSTVTEPRPRTLVEKIWDDHVVAQDEGAPAVLAIDLHLVHEVTSPQAFTGLRERGLPVRRPDRTVATADHSTPTTPRGLPIVDQMAAAQIRQLDRQLQPVRHSAPRPGLGHAGNRPRDRAGAGPDPAGHDDRLRRQPHRDPRRVRRARVRDRDERGRDGARHPDAPPARPEDATRSGWTAACGRASAPRTSSSRSSHGSGSAAEPATSSSTAATPSGPSRWRSG